MAASDLLVQISRESDHLLVSLVGEAHLAFDAADEHIRKVLAQRPKRVIVDAGKLTFISSVGMSFLIHLQRSLEREGASMQLRALQPQVKGVLEHARVLHLFDVLADDGAPA